MKSLLPASVVPFVLTFALAGSFGCEKRAEKPASEAPAAKTAAAASLPAALFVSAPSSGDRDVSEARKDAELKVGDQVVLRGRVGGSSEPFVAGRAVFTLVGRGLKACNENPGDTCARPWDYCCETAEEINANSATIQIVDEKGAIVRTDLKGANGLKELSEIVVAGVVAVADGKALVVNAKSLTVVE